MKITKISAVICGIAAVIAAAAALWLCAHAINAPVKLVSQPTAAIEHADSMMSAFCAGDYDAAGAHIYGKPALGAPVTSDDGITELFWQAFIESISYEFLTECYAADNGVAVDLKITYLDISAATAGLKETAEALREKRLEEAEDLDLILDENNEYLPEFLQEVVLDAVKLSLEEASHMIEKEVTVYLVYTEDQWWVVPDDTLLSVFAGGMNE